eukprot:TRINITY_DN5087_c0_g1_i2.p1 TRINITY_DN5087_c0_g1~~TRINITY_DN5087_c0_g1_i2.p1  ORF type:complete len:180 (+),score=54.79 TRINITY_DN5087_c0_g1_i2:57-596(+)
MGRRINPFFALAAGLLLVATILMSVAVGLPDWSKAATLRLGLWLSCQQTATKQAAMGVVLNPSILFLDAVSRTGSPRYAVRLVRQEACKVIVSSTLVFTATNFVCFAFVPPDKRALIDVIVGFFFGIYLAWACQRRLDAPTADPPVADAAADPAVGPTADTEGFLSGNPGCTSTPDEEL